jgi:putative tryptophan/tyrosine transport system substrate-binding protein
MALTIGRRQFMSALAGATVPWPLTAQAVPVIGWLFGISSESGQPTLAAFRKTLGDAGYVEGRNLNVEYRWADGRYDRLPAMAADLVARPVTLIVTGGGEPAAFAAKAATSTIPIVMVGGSDPVKEGFVASLNRPGGNITGATVFSYDMESKRLGLLHEATPAAKTVAMLLNPANPAVELQLRDVREAAPVEERIGPDQQRRCLALFHGGENALELAVGIGSESDDFDADARSRRAHLIALAAQHRLPAI